MWITVRRLTALFCIAAILFAAVSMPDALDMAELLSPLWLFLCLVACLMYFVQVDAVGWLNLPIQSIRLPRPPPVSSFR